MPAVNAATAWYKPYTQLQQRSISSPTPRDWEYVGNRIWPSSIGLEEMFNPNEVNSLHAYRANGFVPNGTGYFPPVNDNGVTRTDFSFIGEDDAFWMQAGQNN